MLQVLKDKVQALSYRLRQTQQDIDDPIVS
jgi:hypothetical protein